MKEFNVIYVVDDGVATLSSGVGSIARNFFQSFREVQKRFQDVFDIKLRLHVITFSPSEDSTNASVDVEELIKQFEGSIIEIPWPTELTENYFNFSAWRSLNDKVSSIINGLKVNNKLIIANDLIFGLISPNAGDKLLFIPHSLHEVQNQAYVDQEQRQAWENEVFDFISKRKESYVGFLNGFTKKIIEKSYGVDPKKLIPTISGLVFNKGSRSSNKNEDVLDKYNIPKDKNLIVTISRADTYKGLEATISTMKKFLHTNDAFCGVVVASRFSNEPHLVQYLKMLQNKAKNERITFIDQFDPVLPQKLLAHSKTKLLLSLPKSDFAPLLPLEAAAFSHSELAVVLSDAECFKEIFTNNKTAFITKTNTDTTLSLLSQLIKPSSRPLIKRVNRKSKQIIHSRYDLGINSFDFISTLAFGSSMELRHSAGGIISKKVGNEEYVLLAQHLGNTYSFPKGHIEPGETTEMAATREIIEETGYINFRIQHYAGDIHRYSKNDLGTPNQKTISMFEIELMDESRKSVTDEITEWIEVNHAAKLMRYGEDRAFLEAWFLLNVDR